MRVARRTAAAILAWPALVGAATTAGLAAGLVGEGGWDALAWTGLLLPVSIAVRAR